MFSKILLVAVAAVPALATVSFHPPGGSGTIQVTIFGNTSPTGCLLANGQWSVSGPCATFGGDGVGDMSTSAGVCSVNTSGNIVCSGTAETNEWLGLYVDGSTSALFLGANPGSTNPTARPIGGWTWFAPNIPSGSSSVAINALTGSDAEHITLSWVASS